MTVLLVLVLLVICVVDVAISVDFNPGDLSALESTLRSWCENAIFFFFFS